jgi:hypothetical protein
MNAFRRALPLLSLAVLLLAPSGAFALDLTGCWDNTGAAAADNGVCYFRQATDAANSTLLFWNCRQTGQSAPAWTNIAFGTIHKDSTIGLNWADDPQGQNRGSGTLTLKVDNDNQVSWVASAGDYFGSRTWKRRASCP